MSSKGHTHISDSPESVYENAECRYFTAELCHSCNLLGITPGTRVKHKVDGVLARLTEHGVSASVVENIVLPKHIWGSRRKIKMAVAGSSTDPIIGIVHADLSSQELLHCPLTPQPLQSLLTIVRSLIQEHGLHPYDIVHRNGELKYLIVMADSEISQVVLRFVLRSAALVPQLRAITPELQSRFPWLTVVTCNIQPKHAAILDGPEEMYLTSVSEIRELFNEVPLYFSPQSFMQVTPEIAAQLYARAREFAAERHARTALDLFCGVGGFSLHVARTCSSIIGVESSPSAVASAARSAHEIGASRALFFASDVESFLVTHAEPYPDLVIVNPPRRGLSPEIIRHILRLAPKSILYSSCNPETFARDARELMSQYSLQRLAPFDMFPMTSHCEVLGEFIAI